jgi:hypothetical protein
MEYYGTREIGLNSAVTNNTGVPGSIPYPTTIFSPLFPSISIVLVLNVSFLVFIADRNRNFTGYFWPWSLNRNKIDSTFEDVKYVFV